MSKTKHAIPPIERQRRLREKRYAAGFRLCGEWVHVSDFEVFKNFAKELRRRRFDVLAQGLEQAGEMTAARTAGIRTTKMDINEISYCLAKQLATMTEIATCYGSFTLDDEMRGAVEKTLRPMLEKRMSS